MSLTDKIKSLLFSPKKNLPAEMVKVREPMINVHKRLMMCWGATIVFGTVALIWVKNDSIKSRREHMKLRQRLTDEVVTKMLAEKRAKTQMLHGLDPTKVIDPIK